MNDQTLAILIERPTDVVKELIENSIDAGATRIEVAIEDGGRRLICVRDDGKGLSPKFEELERVFTRHDTSKIKSDKDSYGIKTLGFRGEALALIANVSKVLMRTRSIDNPVGAEITLHGGRIIQYGLADTPCGTSVEVRDLFLNVPARRKFLKSAATEESRIANIITYNYALANPSITFTLTKDGQENIHFSPVNTLRERAVSCWDDEFVSGLIEVNGEADEIRLRGFISSLWRV
jgi:DNA mismatch repair protein MutL